MNAILNGFSDLFSTTGQQTEATQLWELAGWTMCLFLIAGTVVALIGGLLHRSLRNTAPQIRYPLSLAVFATLAALPIGISLLLFQNLPEENLVVETDVVPLELTPSETSSPLAAADTTTPPVIDLKYNPITVDAEIPALPETNVTEFSNEVTDTPQKNEGVTAFLTAISFNATAIKYLPWLWIIGAPLTFLLLSTGLIGSERLRKHSKQLVDGPLFDAGEKLRGTLKISRRVGIAVCERIASPLLVGVFRPMILLPPAALTGWTPEQIEMVLLHELAHVRRWDNLVNFFQRIVESLLFFHPAVWWVSRWVRADREECCDAVVVARTEQPQAYAELLVALATPRSSSSSPLVGLAMAQHPLAGRIRRILKLEDEKMLVTRSTFAWLTLAMVAVIAVAAWQPMTTSIAQESVVAEISNDETTKDAKETKQAKQVTKIYLLKENDNIPIAKWVKRLDQHNISPIHYYEKNDGLVVSCTQAQHEQLADLLEEHRAAEETKHTLGRPSVLFVLTAKTPQSTIDAFIEWNNKRDGNTCTVTKLANGALTLTIEDKAGNIHTTKAQRFTALEGGRIEIEGEVSQTVLPASLIDQDTNKLTDENANNKEDSIVEAIFSDQIPAIGAEPRDEKLWQKTQTALIKSDLVLRQAVLAIAQNPDFQAPSVSWFQDNLRVRFIPGGVILGLQENKPNSGGLLSYYVKEVGKSYLAERKRQQIRTVTENTKSTFFPSLADQRDADLAYKLLNIEFEPLDASELKRVKAAKFAGGLRAAAGSINSVDGIWKDDILVGLHVWPTSSLADVRKILEREDIRELVPLKYYVLRKQERSRNGTGGTFGEMSPNGTDHIVTGRIRVDTSAIKSKSTNKPPAPVFQIRPLTSEIPFRNTPQPKVTARNLKVGDEVKIIVAGGLPDQPIHDVYRIEEMGTVALGPTYGRVKLAGLTLLEAEEKVKKQLKTVLKDAQVQITLFRKLGDDERSTFNATLEPSPAALAEVKQKHSFAYKKAHLEKELLRAQHAHKSAVLTYKREFKKLPPTEQESKQLQLSTPINVRQAQAKVRHAELIVQRAEAMLADLIQKEQSKTQKPTLLYDGKTFDEWRTQWKTELKTEERTEAIRALAAFGRAGYGKEAAETILDVAGEYDFQLIESSPVGNLKTQVLAVLATNNGQRLATNFWLPKLLERYQSDPKKWHWLANQALWRLSSLQGQDQWTQQQLLKLARDKDDVLSIAAIHALQSSPIDDSQVVTLIDELIASDDNKQVLQGISLLRCNAAIGGGGFGGGGGGGGFGGGTVSKMRSLPALLKVLQHADLKIRRQARYLLQYVDNDNAEQIINLLEKKLQTAKTDQERIPIIRSFAVLGARAKSANDLLENFQDKQYSKSVRLAAGYAYACFWTPTGHNKYLTYANKFQDGSGAPINGENFHKEAKQIFPEPEKVSGGGGFGGGGGGGMF